MEEKSEREITEKEEEEEEEEKSKWEHISEQSECLSHCLPHQQQDWGKKAQLHTQVNDLLGLDSVTDRISRTAFQLWLCECLNQ